MVEKKEKPETPAPKPEIIWWASCDTFHGLWNGPDRNSQTEAEADKKVHDDNSHGGEDRASVLSTDAP